ncbi:MAG: chemotaxis-specific protein-glutamate methyltransferase CheB [Anaerolineae bacterium]|nr:chemotaxis-specific protein-glutamate methyltransferase CheB [Anaerolineae bacterium]
MIRVLIVEDSPTLRILLKTILESDPEITVIGMATDGEEGIRQALALKPDLITMDVHLPGIDGFTATRRIMEQQPTPIVIVSSSVDRHEVMTTFNAIQAGALDVLQKPTSVHHPDFAALREKLITTVKLMAEVKVIRRYRSPMAQRRTGEPARAGRTFSVLAMGASTGGPAALNAILRDLPAGFPLPVLVVQHMTIGFTAGLVAWLQLESRLPIKIAEEGEYLRPGTVYVAPDDTHLVVAARGIVGLSKAPPVSHVRPSATVLFESVARIYGADAIGVLLTGMGDDGAAGLRAMRERGAATIAQDEATSAVYGMPKAAVDLGAADQVLPLPQISGAILALVGAA